jgi:FtsP/CotA-like multicopper oxidase with cupredoxin domain
VSLNEEVYEPADVPFAALLGRFDPATNEPTPLLWADPITENPAVGSTEIWEMRNYSEDAHPIHIHLVQFQVLGREVIGGGTSIVGSNDPLPWERGWKDTIIAYPGEITRVKMRFDLPGFYVWHCHIVEHEDNEMMRPYHVGPIPPDAPAQ